LRARTDNVHAVLIDRYDSWWYKKSNDSDPDVGAPAHGAVNWTDADPAIFPSGLRAMYRKTGW
jgi:hypothetical protein